MFRQGSTGRPGTRTITAGDIYSLPEGGHLKYDLLEEIGQGTYGLVHKAVLTDQTEQVAIKIIENFEENIEEILQEYRILFDHSLHPNIPMLFGAYRSEDISVSHIDILWCSDVTRMSGM